MSGQLDRIHKLEQQLKTITKELDAISTLVPSCEKCGNIDLDERAYLYRCNGCSHLTPKVLVKYIRIPNEE